MCLYPINLYWKPDLLLPVCYSIKSELCLKGYVCSSCSILKAFLSPKDDLSDLYANLNFVKYSTRLHIVLGFKDILCTLMDVSQAPGAPNVCLAL